MEICLNALLETIGLMWVHSDDEDTVFRTILNRPELETYEAAHLFFNWIQINQRETMDKPVKCPECGASAIDPCQKKLIKQDECIRQE